MPDDMKTAVLSASSGIPNGTVLETPAGMPNVVVKSVHPAYRILIRVARIYVFSLLGMLTVVGLNVAPDIITPPAEFLDKLIAALGLALAPSFYQLVVNLGEWLTRADA